MKRVAIAGMLVTTREGESIRRDVKLTFDDQYGGSFTLEVLGESPLKGYSFLVKQADLKRTRDAGTPE